MTFKIGDAVQLNGGDQAMTVENIDPNGEDVLCVWIYRGAKGKGVFKAATLVPYSPPVPPPRTPKFNDGMGG